MSNSLERKVRVDQSHCNYQLSNHLAGAAWSILFRDPGRVTRGASGIQAHVLGVFERTGLPIPDIAARLGADLLLIEVDKSARNNHLSFKAYREHADEILGEFNRIPDFGEPVRVLQICFCKVGAERSPSALISEYDLDLVVSFAGGIPALHWRMSQLPSKN